MFFLNFMRWLKQLENVELIANCNNSSPNYMLTNVLILNIPLCSSKWQPNSLAIDLNVKEMLTMTGHMQMYLWD